MSKQNADSSQAKFLLEKFTASTLTGLIIHEAVSYRQEMLRMKGIQDDRCRILPVDNSQQLVASCLQAIISI